MDHDHNPEMIPTPSASTSAPILPSTTRPPPLKRAASSSLIDETDGARRKRLREDVSTDKAESSEAAVAHKESNVIPIPVDELEQELQCGCCSALVYRPVLVFPCQHFFCGSCVVLWIRNGGTNCPACRAESTVVMPFRAIQPLVDLLTRVAPHKARPLNERIQADEVYKAGHTMRLPVPREASPEPNLNQSADLAQPCPNCVPGNPWGWSCPQPIPDPTTDPEHAWHLDNGAPPGHAHCGNCENLLALQAPTTSKCDFCQVYFCGISVPGRCAAAPLLSQQPHNMNEMIDIIQSTDVYDCFNGNAVEVDFMLDYLRAQQLTPKHIYREVVMHTQSQPRGFSPLIEMDIFADIHNVSGGTDPDPEAPRNRICRVCATEVLLWGLKDWWIRERQKGFVSVHITSRRDCPEGSGCQRQKDADHANEFNHIIAFLPGLPPLPPSNEGPSAVDTPLEADNNSGGTDTQPATPHPVFAHDFSPIPPLSLSGIVPDVPPPYGVPPQIARVSSTTEVANLLNNLSQ